MRHLKKHNRLNWKSSHIRAILVNLSKSLIEHYKIRTTLAKAKLVRPFIEKLITKAKKNTLHSKRIAASTLRSWDQIPKLYEVIAEKFRNRPGGYTRIIRLGRRDSDGAEMAYIEFVESFGKQAEKNIEEKTPVKETKEKARTEETREIKKEVKHEKPVHKKEKHKETVKHSEKKETGKKKEKPEGSKKHSPKKSSKTKKK